MDVLHVIHQFLPEHRGGSETYAFQVAKLQQDRGMGVAVLTGTMVDTPEVRVDGYELEGLPVYRLHRDDLYFDHHVKAWHPGVEARFEQLLRELRPELVHVHHWVRLTSNLVEVCARLGIPAVVTLHDYYTSCPRAFRRRAGDEACRRELSTESCRDCVPKYGYEPAHELDDGVTLFLDTYRAELSLAAAVLVAVDSTGDLLAETTGLERRRYRTLPLGYRARFEGMSPLAAPSTDRALRFAYWGGVGRHKGVDVLLRALRVLHAQLAGRFELHVLGGFESEAYQQELRDLSDGLPVTFHGAFEAAQLHAVAPDVGVFPSTCMETFGIVLDECFELGRPCIVSDLGALPERAGGAGLVTRAGDADDLARVMRRLLEEEALWRGLVEQIPPPPPSVDAHVDALTAVYAEARAAAAAPAAAPQFAPVDVQRRLSFLLKQRDTAMSQLLPPGGPR
jgi:glycosyltransferase involved in cell wall biosynthesis